MSIGDTIRASARSLDVREIEVRRELRRILEIGRQRREDPSFEPGEVTPEWLAKWERLKELAAGRGLADLFEEYGFPLESL
jgi:hypothetical protein